MQAHKLARLAKGHDKKSPATAAKIGHELDPLRDTMKGPLDALIESEALQASPFDDPTTGPQLNRAAPKKFKLRRFLKGLFRRDKSKVVRIKAADPQTGQAGVDQLGRGQWSSCWVC